jgi:hypothetical protein
MLDDANGGSAGEISSEKAKRQRIMKQLVLVPSAPAGRHLGRPNLMSLPPSMTNPARSLFDCVRSHEQA